MSTKTLPPDRVESVRRGEIGRDGFDQQVGTSQSTWTSKPLSFLAMVYIYFLARSVWKDFFKGETSGSKITKTWNCLGRSQRK